MADNPDFVRSDLVAGYVEPGVVQDSFGITTSDGRTVTAHLVPNTASSILHNLDEPYRDTTARTRELLAGGGYVLVRGIYYPDPGGWCFEASHICFATEADGAYVFEDPEWWVGQARSIADFYLRAQFGDGAHDWRRYRTDLTLDGRHLPGDAEGHRQETDTISRLVYGLATAYLLTGEDRFLDAAEGGVAHLQENLLVRNVEDGYAYWYHGLDVTERGQRKIFSSEFGDDYLAVPMYEQIYALAGPVQTFRVTGDPGILRDLDLTLALFDRFYRDRERGGYFSHIDPVALDPRAPELGHNRARKNWNSVGDHAPAYLINAFLATGRDDLRDFLLDTRDTIIRRMPQDDYSPFVQERFHEDWSPDREWGWQQDRAVIGHNLKIAWNMIRLRNLDDSPAALELAEEIGSRMPDAGGDRQRGGWYDVVEHRTREGSARHRFAWHDRKAWWQQEQGILAYLVLAGTLGTPEHLALARESAAFYNAFFLDHDDGGVYFNVLADGTPYLVGTERRKGSHSMSGYHSVELCYLAAVYTGLLVSGKPMDLHFRPGPAAFADGLLRVAPDLLPPGRVRISDVWIDGDRYHDFDSEGLLVRLPERDRRIRVKVRLAPSDLDFDCFAEESATGARIVCRGALTAEHVAEFAARLEAAIAADAERIELVLTEVTEMSWPAINELLYLESHLHLGEDLVVVDPPQRLAGALTGTGAIVAGGGGTD
ncbi:AGE family epimerase/isomerase [Saccharopolyspora sp. NPDC003752]